MSKIFVLDSKYQRLNPVPGTQRMPSNQGKSASERLEPLTIIIKNAVDNCQKKDIRIKIKGISKKFKLSNNAAVIPGISHKECNAYRKNYKYG